MFPHAPHTGERAAMLGLSYAELIALEAAEPWCRHWSARFGAGTDRLRAWLAGGRPQAVRGDLCVVGDPAIVRAVRDVVARLPDAAAHCLVGSAMIVGTGRSSSGWCGELPQLPGTASRLIALAVDDPVTIAHEIAHLWQVQGWPADARVNAAALERLAVHVAEDLAASPEARAYVDEREHAATALGNLWLAGNRP